ncbi:MAG TPA: carbonic anhydrase family protein [Gammaproteobacteria bacterium]|nr:carbonic anhydrase family protein [Gammaproteobacteria bacterium]
MNRNFQKILLTLFTLFLFNASRAAEDTWTYTQSAEKLKLMTPATGLQLLKEGNDRFVSGKMKNRNFLQQAKLTKKGQHPFAFILGCMDSRGSPELIFDQGIGDIFAGRVAGNVVDSDQLGGMEFATQVMGSHVIVVMGHTSCGAVKGACTDTKLGNLTQLINKIMPAVNTVGKNSTPDCENTQTVNAIAKQNVLNMVKEIEMKSPIIKKLIAQKQVIIVGAMHDLSTGRVTFLQPS